MNLRRKIAVNFLLLVILALASGKRICRSRQRATEISKSQYLDGRQIDNPVILLENPNKKPKGSKEILPNLNESRTHLK